jgi:uncharacterized protein
VTGLLVLVIRVVLVLLVLRFLLRFVTAVVRGYQGVPEAPGGPHVVAPPVELVRDEVCGTYVPRSRALFAEVGGRTAHFCSAACRDRALAARN